MDKKDLQILSLLQQDASISLADLAEELVRRDLGLFRPDEVIIEFDEDDTVPAAAAQLSAPERRAP